MDQLLQPLVSASSVRREPTYLSFRSSGLTMQGYYTGGCTSVHPTPKRGDGWVVVASEPTLIIPTQAIPSMEP